MSVCVCMCVIGGLQIITSMMITVVCVGSFNSSIVAKTRGSSVSLLVLFYSVRCLSWLCRTELKELKELKEPEQPMEPMELMEPMEP